MTEEDSIILRFPILGKDTSRLATCALRGPWLYDLPGLLDALLEISKPSALSELASLAGGQALWTQGQSLKQSVWHDEGWTKGDVLAYTDWARESVRGFELGYFMADGSKRKADWREGGWIWSIEHSCWMTQTFTLSVQKEGIRKGVLQLQPAALTLWQWDSDMFNSDFSGCLSGHDLEKTANRMFASGLEVLIKGLSNGFTASPDTMARLNVLHERSTLAEVCGKNHQERGVKRL